MPLTSARLKSAGFTLLELLVVLVILGSMLSLVSLSYQVDNDEETLAEEAQAARLFLQYTLDQAWLDGVTFGVIVSTTELSVQQWRDGEWQDTSRSWAPAAKDIRLRLSQNTGFENMTEAGLELVKGVDLVFSASGEYSPFTLDIEFASTTKHDKPRRNELQGDGANALHVLNR